MFSYNSATTDSDSSTTVTVLCLRIQSIGGLSAIRCIANAATAATRDQGCLSLLADLFVVPTRKCSLYLPPLSCFQSPMSFTHGRYTTVYCGFVVPSFLPNFCLYEYKYGHTFFYLVTTRPSSVTGYG